MNEQEKLLKEIASLSDAIRRKNRALRLGISERDKYLETTFKPVIGPLKEMVQTVRDLAAPSESDLILPISKFEKQKDDTEESSEARESNDSNTSIAEDEEEEEEEDVSASKTSGEDEESVKSGPSNISMLGRDITSIGALGTKYLLKMLHTAPVNRNYHVYGARLEGNGLMIGDTALDVDPENNISIGDKKYKGTIGLFELIFKSNPENYTKRDLIQFKEICKNTNAHKKGYAANNPVHRNTSQKYKSIISELFPRPGAQLKRKAVSTAELNVTHKKRKKVLGQGLLKDAYSTNVIYYNDINKLVTRMRLLYEAMEAGHTGLENEWVALSTELKNRGVIE